MRSIDTEQALGKHTLQPSSSPSSDVAFQRPGSRGKFLYVGDEKFWIRGVTYGTFRPDASGSEYHSPEVLERDFALIAASGMNAIRTYTVPPRWLLDAAQRSGLRVMVGIPWEQHVAFLDDRKRGRSIEERVRAGVRACAGHPAVLCYAVGNEIPAPIVRWHGARRVERWIERLYRAAKDEDPAGLVTYVNYPTTEYLQLPFIDLVCFNVYLESQSKLEAYLARLQNIAGERPLLMTEIGLDSHRHSEEAQAAALDWQVRSAFAAGCAGAFVFAWTDEWHRGGYDIKDWKFGLTERDRRPKPALGAVRAAFAEVPFPSSQPWPRISVVVCTYNGHRTIRECLKGLSKVEYPNLEVIVVDDGSVEPVAPIAEEYGFWVIRTENRGLSNARNTGMEAASGEIVAYIDDDAYPDPHWLIYLAATFIKTTHAGVGGPNIAPAGGGDVAGCVANAPGGPTHVLLSDVEAEHIPGCNMAFRKAALQAIGGFDSQFRIAGDDVDVCWRLQERGWTLGFNPAAMVWHHRRNSVRMFWKQQVNYGKAEAMLERKWPEKYNHAGHVTWSGRVYGNGVPHAPAWLGRIYHGTWGGAPFQSLYQPAPNLLQFLPQIPEWYLVNAAFAGLAALGIVWAPLLWALALLGLSAGLPLAQAALSAGCARFPGARSRRVSVKLRVLTALLHLMQPLARLRGRLSFGLTPWRRRCLRDLSLPVSRVITLWNECWLAPPARLRALEATLRKRKAVVLRSGDFDGWDLEVQGGLFGAVRMLMAIEEHGAGRQLVRFRTWPRFSIPGIGLIALFGLLSGTAALDERWGASLILGIVAGLLGLLAFWDSAVAEKALLSALEKLGCKWK